MTKEKYGELECCVKDGISCSRDSIEAAFPAAFRRIKGLAKEMGVADYWDMRVMKEYWHFNHNKIIDEREGNYSRFPESFCDFCKVHEAEVLKVLSGEFLLVGYDGKKRPVLRDYVLDAKVGDRVRIHQAYAVEKI
jgi:hypothetical protein